MNEEQDLKLTDFDYLIGDSHLQMIKAALPYMNVSEQKMISLLVKTNELRRTYRLFQEGEVATMGICSAGERPAASSPIEMLTAMKPFGSEADQDFIDLILNFFQGFHIANAYQESVSKASAQNINQTPPQQRNGNPLSRVPFDQLKNFMSPEQQSRMETMQMVMSAMQQM